MSVTNEYKLAKWKKDKENNGKMHRTVLKAKELHETKKEKQT